MIVLGYWNIRGLAQHIRNMLEYVGEEFEDRVYDFDADKMANVTKSSFKAADLLPAMGKWPEDKTGHPDIVGSASEPALEFPNLPYYIETKPDGSKLKLSQSTAITRRIARRHGLIVEGEDAVSKMDLYEQQALDFRLCFLNYCYDNPMSKLRYPNFIEDIKVQFAPWEKLLTGKQWVMGDKLTYVDFLLVEAFEWFIFMKKNVFEPYPAIQAYIERFKKLPKLAEYFGSPRFKKWPIVSPFAPNFGWDEKQIDK